MPSVTATVPPPPLRFVEYRLPGSCQVRAYTSKRALVSRDDAERGTTELLLLDLSSGRNRSLLSMPVAGAQGLVFSGCTLSDDVVAWEEVSPRDADFPEETVWRLFACGYDASKGLVGSPVLVDGSDRGARSRPLFHVDGQAVVWLSNARRAGGYSGRVQRFDVASGERSTVLEAATPFDTLSLSERRVLVTRETTSGAEEVLSLSPGERKPTVTKLSGGMPSHFPAMHDGAVAWAVLKPDKPWPDLFLSDSKGRRLLAPDALDPVFAGDYLFYESNEASDAPRDHCQYGSIWGIRPGTDGKFRLLLTEVSVEGWWQTALAQGYVDDVFVVHNDLSPWNGGKDRSTLVRVYRFQRRG